MMWKRWNIGVVLIVAVGGAWLACGPARVWADNAQDEVTFTDMDQMIFDARQAFRQRRFDVAITTC